MCGIVGVYYFDRERKVRRSLINRMSLRIAHRGPDGAGTFLDGNLGFGHRRLSVIDIRGGAQPMTDERSGRTIVYNGEFYNFREVAENLRGRGHSFSTQCDTEVLLKLASGDPREWLTNVNGMFAFAVWDSRTRVLTLVRDRFGVKPLYYILTDTGLAFASEIKALFDSQMGLAPEIDTGCLGEYLAFRSVLEPRTLFRGVHQVPAGHFMTIGPGRGAVQIRRYWSESSQPSERFEKEGVPGEFSERFADAVRRRLVSDVPLGTFNSGGVDSALVTAEVRRQRSGELHTFSIGFEETAFDETEYSLKVADVLRTTHHAAKMTPAEYVSKLPKAIWHHDEPLSHPHTVHLMHLSGIAKQAVTVVLTGEGADETFFGYPRLHIPHVNDLLGPFSAILAKPIREVSCRLALRRWCKFTEALTSGVDARIDSQRSLPLDDLVGLVGDMDYVGYRATALEEVPAEQTSLERLLEFERNSYLKSLLVRLDKMTMAYGLEARTPFLDYEFVLWSKQIRAWHKIGYGFQTKRLLKSQAVQQFPRAMVYRRKAGFGVPLAAWFREDPTFRDILDSLTDGNSFVASVFPRGFIIRLINEHLAEPRRDHSEALWTLTNLELWSKTMLIRPANTL